MFLDERTARLSGWMRNAALGIGALALVGLGGCDDDETPAPDPAPVAEPEPMAEPEPDPEPGQEGVVASHKARVKFKGGERYARDLSAALELPRDQLCTELGLYDCVDEVHRISLGGVEPYELGIDEPLPVAPVSAAIAVDRVALSACIRRVELDFADPGSAVVFGSLATAGGPQRADLEAVAADLIDRILRRDATPAEISALADFYVDAEAEADAPAQAFGQLSCFAVATMLEALFY